MVPLPLRESQHWEQGTSLMFIETDRGVVVATRDQAKAIVRDQLSGPSLVDDLIEQRRADALGEDDDAA